MDLSSRLRNVSWERLEHAYDDAADIPGLLLEIGGSDDPERIVGMLHLRLVHQGYVVYSATVEAVPILVDMVLEAGCPARPAIVGLIGDLAREAARAEPGTDPQRMREMSVLWSRMWREKLPLMADLLHDGDVEVRRVASSPLASAEFDQDLFLQRLLEVCAAKLAQLTAVADLLPAVAATVRDAAVSQVAGIVAGGSPQVRMAGAFALCQVEPVGAKVFADALHAPDVELWRQTWCVPGRRQSIAYWVDNRLREDRDLRRDLGKALLASTDPSTRVAGIGMLMRVASTWRSPMADLAAAAFETLDDPAESVSDRAVFALALSRSRVPGHADRLAELADGSQGYPRLAAT